MKDVSNQQIAEHLKRLNPWWGSGAMDAETLALHPRAYLDPVRRLLQEPKLGRAVVLLGPRRVGKTILIRHLIADLRARASFHKCELSPVPRPAPCCRARGCRIGP